MILLSADARATVVRTAESLYCPARNTLYTSIKMSQYLLPAGQK